MITGLLLAAGTSRRFGSNKLLHELEGEALVVTCAKKLAAQVDEYLVVVRKEDKAVQTLLASIDIHFVACPNTNGMGDSLSFAIQQTQNASSWMTALADMPFIHSHDYQNCYSRLRDGASLTAPRWQKQRGHPAGISSQWKNELLKLEGDQGARLLFQQNEPSVEYFEAFDDSVLRDIDSPRDLQTI